MPKMTIRIILKNGSEFSVKCDEFTMKENALGVVTGYDIKGITENKPVYLDFGQVAAVVRTLSDETAGEKATKCKKKKIFKELKTKCPLCEGDNENAVIYADEENKEFFVYCKTCSVETIDAYTSKAKALKAFSDGKTKPIRESEANTNE